MKPIAVFAAVAVVAWAVFIFTAINTLCDESYWPDWE